jgi:RHS repeat-associated protein
VTLSHLTGLHESRRIQKWTVWLTGSIFGKVHTVQKRNGSNNPLVSYTRGNDLSGTMEGAGGIGGLLARSSGYSGGNFTVHNYYFADGNGNITYLLDNSPTMVAKYRYDAFGNTISKSGTLADANVYRFSSKEIHVSSGMYYYGHRFYEPNLQRWVNRDPIGERGDINLFRFVRNQPTRSVDPLGWIIKFDPNADPCFRGKVLRDMARLMSSSTGSNLLYQAQSSPYVLTIEEDSGTGEEGDWESGATSWGTLGDPKEGLNAWISLDPTTENGASILQNVMMNQFGEGVPDDATGGAVVLGHELGHAVGGVGDTANVDVNENPIRADLLGQSYLRPSYHGEPLD